MSSPRLDYIGHLLVGLFLDRPWLMETVRTIVVKTTRGRHAVVTPRWRRSRGRTVVDDAHPAAGAADRVTDDPARLAAQRSMIEWLPVFVSEPLACLVEPATQGMKVVVPGNDDQCRFRGKQIDNCGNVADAGVADGDSSDWRPGS